MGVKFIVSFIGVINNVLETMLTTEVRSGEVAD